jgi:hypothetical protein
MTDKMTYEKQSKIRDEDFKTHGTCTEFVYKNYKCSIQKHKGHWCGYIHINGLYSINDYDSFMGLHVHGGITCISPNPITKKTLIGFDCAHVFDFSIDPLLKNENMERCYYYEDQYFRTFDYVKENIENAVDELIKMNIKP